ncbi:carbohydrate ABC transporter permease [Diplocloster modestus]|uniref:Sugar ABC transporter permease n=1 Tax=Diplocloster modestus TaxID=2850322 RepID=A0ABS6K4L1_9FIRM|nr:sugar ABC transporter permease [Diplocloster modestus]MBU9725481.1 sugar ABC transporter permease [Diplocloster modestus]
MFKKSLKRNEKIAGLLFIVPSMAQFLFFFLLPLGLCIWASFTDWNVLVRDKSFIGLGNFAELFQDRKFWIAMRNTVYMLLPIPAYMVLGLLFALACHKNIKGNKVFRVLYYLPYISSIVALVLIWKWIFNSEFGLVNQFLGLFGFDGPNWLNDPTWTRRMIILMIGWKMIGITAIYFLASLKNLPETYYEAATIDGATSTQQFFRITLPLLTPILFYLVTVNIIGSLQTFIEVNLFTTDGGRNYGVATIIYYIWQKAFDYSQMGYACSAAVIFGLFILLLTALQFKISNKWVYEGE